MARSNNNNINNCTLGILKTGCYREVAVVER